MEFVGARDSKGGREMDLMSKDSAPSRGNDERRRWWALIALCLGLLMIAFNTTIVNVALPLIRLDLHFSEASLVWVTTAYLATSCYSVVGSEIYSVGGGSFCSASHSSRLPH
jgi:hypothetical protein